MRDIAPYVALRRRRRHRPGRVIVWLALAGSLRRPAGGARPPRTARHRRAHREPRRAGAQPPRRRRNRHRQLEDYRDTSTTRSLIAHDPLRRVPRCRWPAERLHRAARPLPVRRRDHDIAARDIARIYVKHIARPCRPGPLARRGGSDGGGRPAPSPRPARRAARPTLPREPPVSASAGRRASRRAEGHRSTRPRRPPESSARRRVAHAPSPGRTMQGRNDEGPTLDDPWSRRLRDRSAGAARR